MQLSRRSQLRISWVLNGLLPPSLRDARWFMRLPMRLVYGRDSTLVMDFKERAYRMTENEIVALYRQLGARSLARGTDLNAACIERVAVDAVGPTVLEVGCGEGALAARLSRAAIVTACDIVVREEVVAAYPQVSFREASVECLPFREDEFDTVVSTHALEHVRDIRRAVDEMRRVAKRRVIVVVPKERPYRYTFNLHLHFFPYEHELLKVFGGPAATTAVCETVDGDLYYCEDVER